VCVVMASSQSESGIVVASSEPEHPVNVEEDDSEKLTEKGKLLKKLQSRYSHVIVQLIEDLGNVELFQIRSGWLFLESETEDIWCWYPNCEGSGKYLVKCPLPDLNDAAANFTRYKCRQWPRKEDCFTGKTHFIQSLNSNSAV
jgi:hypothetical protein